MTDRDKLLKWAKFYCNNDSLTDDGSFSLVLDSLIQTLERVGVTSESLDDMSQSFSGDAEVSIGKLLSPYRRFRSI